MTINKYIEAINLLISEKIDIEEPIDTGGVNADDLENRFGHKLSPSYRKMLNDYGSLEFDTVEIYGLTKSGLEGKSIPSVVYVTEQGRASGELSNRMVEIMSSGYGPRFVIDFSQSDPHGESPVYEIHELGYEHGMKKTADSFGEFLLNEVKMLLANR